MKRLMGIHSSVFDSFVLVAFALVVQVVAVSTLVYEIALLLHSHVSDPVPAFTFHRMFLG